MAEKTMDLIGAAIDEIGKERFISVDIIGSIEATHRNFVESQGFRLQKNKDRFYLVRN